MKAIYQGVGASVLVLLDEQNECYVVQMIGKISKKSYQVALRAVLKNLQEDPYPNVLLNIKDLESKPDLGLYWLWAHFAPRFYKITKELKIAIVKPKSKYAVRAMGVIGKLLSIGKVRLQARQFEELSEAQDWLEGFEPEKKTKQFFRLPFISNGKKETENDEYTENRQYNRQYDDKYNNKYDDYDEYNDKYDDDKPEKKLNNWFVKASNYIKKKIGRAHV